MRREHFDELTARRDADVRVAHDWGSSLAAIQSAVDDLTSGGYVWVSKDSGPYPANADVLNLPSAVRVIGDGAEITAGSKDVEGGDTLVVTNDDITNGNDNITLNGLDITGKVRIAADAAAGNYCSNITLDNVRCYDVPDFAFDLSDVMSGHIRRCYTSNAGVGGDDNGNDGLHLTDSIGVYIEDYEADSGDDVLAVEANSLLSSLITINHVTGTSNVGDLVKFYTNPNTDVGDNIFGVSLVNPKADGGLNSAIEFENDGSGEIYDIGVRGLDAYDISSGIISNDYTNVHHVRLYDCTIRRTQQSLLNLGKSWESYGGTYVAAGMSGNAYQGVEFKAADAKLIGGEVGPATNHVILASGDRFTVKDVTVDALSQTIDGVTINPAQGIRVNGLDGTVENNDVDADNDWAIGSSGTDAGTLVWNNTYITNGLGDGQFSSDAILGSGLIGVVGYQSGDFIPLVYGSGVNTSDDDTTSSTYSTATNGGDGIITWDHIQPSRGSVYCGYFGRIDLLNGSTMDVRVRNVTDGETICERTGISSTGPFDIDPVAYTPTTTSSPIHYQAEIASTDGTNTVRLDDGSPVFGVQV